ncbi:DUF805 domain-containing protein [Limoniibacter endophyticus]|nr:DUF805 domain-containing protein [Limoniibacter endophyticus]
MSWVFFGATGRISRMVFLLGNLLLAVIQAFFVYQMAISPEGSAAQSNWAAVASILYFFFLWPMVMLGIKRLHDIDRPGIFSISLVVPILSIAAFIYLCVQPGTAGANQYGYETNRANPVAPRI